MQKSITLELSEESYVELCAALHGWALRLAKTNAADRDEKLRLTKALHEQIVEQVTGQLPLVPVSRWL